MLLIRQKEEICFIPREEVSDERLYKEFSDNTEKSIYIVVEFEGGREQYGIVTLGSYRRYTMQGKPLINYDFCKVLEKDEGTVESIFEQNEKINSIPIVNENGQIIKEYYRKKSNDDCKVSVEYLKLLLKELRISNKENKVILVGDEIEDICQNNIELKQLVCGYEEKIVVKNALLREELSLLSEEKNVCVYDFQKNYRLREIMYKKFNIDNFFVNFTIDKFIEILSEQLNYLKGAAFTEDLYEFFDVEFRERYNISKIDINKIRWNVEGHYEYEGEIEENIEFVITILPLKQHILTTLNRVVPIVDVCFFLDINDEYSNLDIAINIIPKLENNGVRCIVLGNPHTEYVESDNEITKYIQENIEKEVFMKYNYETIWDTPNEAMMYKRNFLQNLSENEFSNEIKTLESRFVVDPYTNTFVGKYINYIMGERVIWDNPKEFTNNFFLFGLCTLRGEYAADDETPGSYLRKKIPNFYYIKTMAYLSEYTNIKMRKETYKAGDVAVIMTHKANAWNDLGVKVHSIMEIYLQMPNLKNNVWDALTHINATGNRYLAEKIYSICCEEEVFRENDIKDETEITFTNRNENVNISSNLQKWILQILPFKNNMANKSGSIVMNANPFTKGHRYLVEKALEEADCLYIFVLEEDKSFFSFEDRLNMVRLGVSDLENVIVIPSGKYIISTRTMPGYFKKETCPFVEKDAVVDLEIFASVIAKVMGIKARFAGEEPIDQFTKKYNDTMKKVLPKYNIEFVEIPRKTYGDEVISASRVRKYIGEGKWSEIEKIVLKSVYEYLEKHYRDSMK